MFLSIFIRHWATIDHGALEVIAKRRRVCIAYIGGSVEEHRGQWKRAGEVLDAQSSMGAFSIGWADPKSLFVLAFCFILELGVFILVLFTAVLLSLDQELEECSWTLLGVRRRRWEFGEKGYQEGFGWLL